MQTLLEKLKELYLNLEGLPPDRIVPTVGLNIGRIEVGNTKLVFWDLGGQVWTLQMPNIVLVCIKKFLFTISNFLLTVCIVYCFVYLAPKMNYSSLVYLKMLFGLERNFINFQVFLVQHKLLPEVSSHILKTYINIMM